MASPGEIEKLERRWLENMQGLTFAPLAEAYRKAGRLDEAFQTLELGLAHHPDYLPAHIVRGRCALDAGDDGAAATAFAVVLSFDSLNLIALRGLAEISLRSGRPQEAILHLRRLLDVDQTDLEAANRLAELQAAATQAPAPEYAPPPREEASPEDDSAGDETVLPRMEFGDTESPRDTPDDFPLVSGTEAEAPDPIDLRIDERWSYPGATSEFALANDSEALSVPTDSPDPSNIDRDRDLDAPEISLPPLDVVPTLKDLPEDELDTADVVDVGMSPPADSEKDDEDPHPEERGFWMETEAESEPAESPVVDPDDVEEVTMPPLETGAEEVPPPNPWTPAELPAQAIGDEEVSADVPVHEDIPSIGMESHEDDSPDGLVEAEMEPPHRTDSGMTEPPDEAEPEAWPDGPPAVYEVEVPREVPSDEEPDSDLPSNDERDPDVPSVTPVAEQAPSPTTSTGWMSGEPDRDETPESAPGEPSDELTEGRGEEDDGGALVVTETMAEIFLRQGHDELALAVYTELARRDPDDARLQEAIERLAPAPEEDATPVDTPDPVAPGRYAASSTGGESLGDFLAGVLAVREPISPTAITPPAMDRPREGEPTRPADKHFGLDSVFGDDPTDASVSSTTADDEAEGSSPSFDEFFGDRPPVIAPPSGSSPASGSEDLQHFNDWLKGLKR